MRTKISDELKKFIEDDQNLIPDDSNKQYIRFTTNKLDEIIPKISDWTSSKRLMLFEIDNLNPLKIALVLGKGEDEQRRELYEVARRNEFKGISTLNRHFPRMYSSELYEYKEYENYEETLDKVVEQMQSFISKTLPEIENTIINQYNK